MAYADVEWLNKKIYDTGLAVTPSDSADLTAPPYTMVHCGSSGALVVDMLNGATNLTLAGVAAGQELEIEVVRIRDTGTTCTPIVVFKKQL